MVPRSWFLRFSWNLVSVQHYMVFAQFSGFSRPRPAQEPFFVFVLLRPKKNNTDVIFLEILVSFWVPVRGGITHFSGSVCLHSRTERKFCKITPAKHMVFEAISGASAHLGPPRSQNGPGHPPRSPNKPSKHDFLPLFIDFRAIF